MQVADSQARTRIAATAAARSATGSRVWRDVGCGLYSTITSNPSATNSALSRRCSTAGSSASISSTMRACGSCAAATSGQSRVISSTRGCASRCATAHGPFSRAQRAGRLGSGPDGVWRFPWQRPGQVSEMTTHGSPKYNCDPSPRHSALKRGRRRQARRWPKPGQALWNNRLAVRV